MKTSIVLGCMGCETHPHRRCRFCSGRSRLRLFGRPYNARSDGHKQKWPPRKPSGDNVINLLDGDDDDDIEWLAPK